MNETCFADVAQLNLRSTQSLSLIGADYHTAQFEITGFEEIRILLTDHRENSLMTLHEHVMGRANAAQWLRSLNQPAFVLVNQAGERTWTIDLYNTQDISPIHTLEIETGLNTPIPIHLYEFYHCEPAARGRYHFLAVYQNDPEIIPVFALRPAFAEL